MQRFAFKMKLMAGCQEEYKRRHNTIWPEVTALLKENGVSDYSIFLDEETNTVFAVQRQAAGQTSQDLGSNAIMKRWWAYMADIMETRADNSPVSIPLTEVFYLA